MKLRCYCCGEPISGRTFALVSPAGETDEVDRTFVMLRHHVRRVEGSSIDVVLEPERDIDLDDGA